MRNTMRSTLGRLGAVTVASATVGVLALTGASAAQAGTASIANGGPVDSANAGSTVIRMVSDVSGRDCARVPTAAAPGGGPLLSGVLPTSSNVAWGSAMGTLSVRFYCPPQIGITITPLVDCTAAGANFTVTGVTVNGETPGTVALQCNVSYVGGTLTGFPFASSPTMTTIAGTVPVIYRNATSSPSAPAVVAIRVAGQTLTVTGASVPGFQTGKPVRLGAPAVGSSTALTNLDATLAGTPSTHPVLASS